MTWPPCQRVVRADIPPAFRIRGIDALAVICWPDAALNTAADYSIDFSALIEPDDRIVAGSLATDGGLVAWLTNAGPVLTAWIAWDTPGQQTVTATVQTAQDRTLTVCVSIAVTVPGALMAPTLPLFSPNAAQAWGGYVTDADGNILNLG